MTSTFTRLLAGLALLSATSCALEYEVPAAAAGPIDSLVRTQTGVRAGKIKFRGPVTFQVGGTGNTASSTAVEKAKAPVATAPHATATTTKTTTRTGPPWWVYALGGGLCLAGGFVLRGRL